MVVNNTLRFVTLEPLKNLMPIGSYACGRHTGTKWQRTIEILVPGHSDVLVHIGNIQSDSEGCVLIGKEILEAGRSIGISGPAYKEFQGLIAQHQGDIRCDISEWVDS